MPLIAAAAVVMSAIVGGLSLSLSSLDQAKLAYACTCAERRSVQEEANDSAAVFAGKVLQIDTGRGGYAVHVELLVENVWKGSSAERVTVETSSSGDSCGYGFQNGERYLVYASRADGSDTLGTSICSRTSLLSEAQQDLKVLTELYDEVPPVKPAIRETIILGTEGWENGSPSRIAINNNMNLVYVANRNSDTVSVINATTNRVVDTISVGFGPVGVAVSPNTNFIYLTRSNVGIITVIDGATNKVVKTLELDNSDEFYSEGGISINEKTNRVYVLTNNSPKEGGQDYSSITVIDGLTNNIEQSFKVADLRWDYDVGDSARDIAVNPETNTIYVVLMFGDLYVIDGASNTVSGKLTIGYEKTPHQIEVNEKTNMAYVSNFNNQSISVINGSKNEIVKTIHVGIDPQGIAIDSASNAIYVVTYAGEVSVINGTINELKGKIPVGEFPERAAFNKNSGFLYVTNAWSNSISVIDTTMSGDSEVRWKTIHVLGRFLNSEPPKPDQVFQVHYRVVNGTAESFDMQQEVQDVIMSNMIVAKVNSSRSNNGVLEIEFPRNFPYSNSGSGIGMFYIFVNGMDAGIEEEKQVTTECFFVFSIPFRGSDVEIQMGVPSILIKAPYHGDDVPDSCIPETIVETTAEQLEMCTRLGIPEESCNEVEIARETAKQRSRQIALSDEETKRIEEQRNQINNAMYLIGIGAAIAGIVAFFTLRRHK